MKGINHQVAYSMDGASTNWAEEYFSRLRRAEIGHHHHIAGNYLLRYAQEAEPRRFAAHSHHHNPIPKRISRCNISVAARRSWEDISMRCFAWMVIVGLCSATPAMSAALADDATNARVTWTPARST
jgi:hypothetical protein